MASQELLSKILLILMNSLCGLKKCSTTSEQVINLYFLKNKFSFGKKKGS